MSFRRFILASLTAMAVHAAAGRAAEACDACRGKTPCQTCAAADDHGLLDALDLAARRLQPRLPRWNMPRVPSLDTALQAAFGGVGGRSPQASCGCELRGASCGCELQPPSCGCEAPSGCDCHLSSRPSRNIYDYEPADPWTSSEIVAPIPTPIPTAPTLPAPARPRTPHAPPAIHQPNSAPAHRVPQHPLQQPPGQVPQPTRPAPARVPAPMPLPDSQVDPFRDDTALRIRQIPARTIQHSQPASTYRSDYDPQASAGRVSTRLSDIEETPAPRWGLDDQRSSRTRTVPAVTAATPAVVTAAGSAPAAWHATSPHDARPLPLGPDNPLRGN